MKQNPKDPVVESAPKDWSAQEETIAKEALRVLHRDYRGYKWGVEFSQAINGHLGVMVIRILDLPTEVCYTINPKDIDIDRMTCVSKGAGEFLEALGLPATHAKRGADMVRGLMRTPAGLIIPAAGAVPDNNPGFEKTKKQYDRLKYGH